MRAKTITINNAELNVKLAYTGQQQARGLMNITSLPDNEGMLFCYPEEKLLSFWMKKTPLPLSIAFIDENKKIIQIEKLEPYNEAGVKTKAPAKWALEVNQDWFDNNNVKVGDIINIPEDKIKIRVVKLPPAANKLAKSIEDKLVDMTMKALKSKLSVDQLDNLNIDVKVK